jgi:DNA end-binding protein Ku
MALRATWTGTLRLSLVTIPIRVFPAAAPSSDISFRQLHKKCHTPIHLKKWCPVCEEELGPEDIVRGYEVEKGRFVQIGDEELKATKPVSTHVVEVADVLPAAALDPLYVERPYFLAPNGAAAAGPFAVVREGLKDRVAIARLALYGREYLVAVSPRARGLVMYTLRYGDQVRSMDAVDELGQVPTHVNAAETRLAKQVIGHFASDARLSEYTSQARQALRKLIDKRAAEHGIVTSAEAEEKPGAKKGAINLMDALRKSLERAAAKSKPPARRKPARVLHYAGRRPARRAS